MYYYKTNSTDTWAEQSITHRIILEDMSYVMSLKPILDIDYVEITEEEFNSHIAELEM